MSSKMSEKKNTQRAEQEIFLGLSNGMTKIVSVYVVLMLAVFPLFITDKYYNCLRDKYYFFFYATAAAAALILILYLAGLVMGAYKNVSLKSVFGKLSVPDAFMIGFLVICTVSTCFSEWKFESFWGNMGRLQGLFFYLLCGVGYFLVTRGYRFSRKHIYLFLASGIIVLLWGFADYLGIDPLGWRADADNYWAMLMFTSTIGNVNTFTAMAAFYFGISAYLTAKLEKPWFAMTVFFIAALALITGQSDNAVFSSAAVFAILPFILFRNRKGMAGYFSLLSLYTAALAFTGLVTSKWTASKVLYESNWGVLLEIANGSAAYCFAAAVIFAAAAVFLFLFRKENREKEIRWLRPAYGILFALIAGAVMFAVFDANSGNHKEFWKPLEGFLVFSDSWGTNRGYAWRNTFDFFKRFGFFRKLFGSGPETYSIYMAKNCYYEMIELSNSVFDSPHSEPIQMLFTTGIAGFVSYYGFFASALKKAFGRGTWSRACAIAVIAYLSASLINISVPLTTPLLFLLAALPLTIGDKDEEIS